INTDTDDYMHITLTDEDDIPDAIGKLRVIYPNLMKLDYDNNRTRSGAKLDVIENIEHRSPLDLFSKFYEKQNNQPMTGGQSEFMESLIESIWEDEK
ncbi:MAG: exonuclease SbcCD subunit D C-terminal domain-containing protein, partial [Acutalibacteraceae bacterium]